MLSESEGARITGTSSSVPAEFFFLMLGDNLVRNLPSAIATACEKQLLIYISVVNKNKNKNV